MPRKKAASRRTRFTAVETEPDEVELDEDEVLDPDETLTDNADAVPLFADIDGRTSRSITQLRLSRVEQGGVAYKGMIPVSSTLDTIGQIYGNGIYLLEGLNSKGSVLHSKENLRISLPELETPVNDGKTDADRIERLARQSANESVAQARSFLELIVTQTNAQQSRERDFYAAQQEQNRVFMASLISMQAAQFTQTIQLMTQSQTAEDARAQRRQQQQPQRANDQLLMETLMRGLKLGRDLSSGRAPDETPVWQSILQGGLGVLANVNNPQLTQQASVNPNVKTPTTVPPPSGKRLSAAQRKLMKDALQLHRAVRSKGIDPRSLTAELLQKDSTSLELVETEPDLRFRSVNELDEHEAPTDDEEDEQDESEDDEDDVLDDESEDDIDGDDDDDSTETDDSSESAGVGA